MKTILFFIALFPLMAFSQVFNSFKVERLYNQVAVKEAKAIDTTAVLRKEPIVAPVLDTIPSEDIETDSSESLRMFDFAIAKPLPQLRITSPYGMRMHPIKKKREFHAGIDLAARGDTITSILDGVVVSAGYHRYLGYHVKVKHGDYTATYGHLSKYFVLEGEHVVSGMKIGVSGNTGRSTGEHLHFAIHYKGHPVNPLQFLYRLMSINQQYAKLIHYDTRLKKSGYQ